MISMLFIAAHMVGDYIVQTDWMAANKLKSAWVRAVHVTCYTLCFAPIVFVADPIHMTAASFLALIWVTHYAADSRRWASGEKWAAKPIMVDQSIHAVTLAILGYWAYGV